MSTYEVVLLSSAVLVSIVAIVMAQKWRLERNEWEAQCQSAWRKNEADRALNRVLRHELDDAYQFNRELVLRLKPFSGLDYVRRGQGANYRQGEKP